MNNSKQTRSLTSKYVTDDGLDLDSRYLGINAKAKSAETADTAEVANKANSVGWEGISDRPNSFATVDYGAAINLAINTTVSATKSGMVSFTVSGGEYGRLEVNNVYLGTPGSNVSSIANGLMVPVSKGDKIKATPGYDVSSSSLRLILYPFKV